MPIRSEFIRYEYDRPNYYQLTDNSQKQYSDKFIVHFEDSESDNQEFQGIEKADKGDHMYIEDTYQNNNRNKNYNYDQNK